MSCTQQAAVDWCVHCASCVSRPPGRPVPSSLTCAPLPEPVHRKSPVGLHRPLVSPTAAQPRAHLVAVWRTPFVCLPCMCQARSAAVSLMQRATASALLLNCILPSLLLAGLLHHTVAQAVIKEHVIHGRMHHTDWPGVCRLAHEQVRGMPGASQAAGSDAATAYEPRIIQYAWCFPSSRC
jgi:hypothetical protein